MPFKGQQPASAVVRPSPMIFVDGSLPETFLSWRNHPDPDTFAPSLTRACESNTGHSNRHPDAWLLDLSLILLLPLNPVIPWRILVCEPPEQAAFRDFAHSGASNGE